MTESTEIAPGLTISRVITGLWQIADMERDGRTIDLAAAAKAMSEYANAGLTTFDMADHYGSAEIIAGMSRSMTSTGMQHFTKWVPSPGPINAATTREAVERALSRLKSQRIQLMQYHAWNYADPSWLDGLTHLSALQREGLIGALGLTNFNTAHMRVANSIVPIRTNQVCYSLLDQRASGAMTEYCLRHGVKILAFGTVAGGFLSEKWLGKPEPAGNELTTWSQMKYKRFIDTAGGWSVFQNLLSTLSLIANEKHCSIAMLASRYMLDQPAVAGVIIGARLGASEHIQDHLKLMTLQLKESDKARIREALRSLKPIPGDCGDEYRKPPFLTASGDLSHHVDAFPAAFQVTTDASGHRHAWSGTIWEELAGFSRGVRKGNRIMVSGTTATHGSMAIGIGDPIAQTHYIIDKIEATIQSLGGKLEDVIRTRIYIRNMDQWEAVSRAHGERFAGIQPANTMVRADLIGDEYLVEIEAEAEVNG